MNFLVPPLDVEQDGVKCEESVAVVSDVKQAKTVKDVSPHEFVTGYAAHLKLSTPGLKLTAAEECLSCMCLFDMCTCMSDTWVYLKLELASSEAMLRINLEIDFQVALHAKTTNLLYPWQPCSFRIWFKGTSESMFPIYRRLLAHRLPNFLYSGDTDPSVPAAGTIYKPS
ncbi:serine carboxypeptidase-like protein 26 [Tanacetum coccineum]